MARDKDSLQKRLSKARGQIEAIKKMIENGLIERTGSKKTGAWKVLK